MAYNSFPVSYQPYYQPQLQTQTNYQNTQSGILWVSNEQEAVSYPVAPNAAVALWDSSRPSVYIKQADASGKPTIKIYDLSERALNASQGASKDRESKDMEYATKSEMDAISREFEALKDEIKTIKREIAKPRKKEVAEDDE